jgi:hypothetical protein
LSFRGEEDEGGERRLEEAICELSEPTKLQEEWQTAALVEWPVMSSLLHEVSLVTDYP